MVQTLTVKVTFKPKVLIKVNTFTCVVSHTFIKARKKSRESSAKDLLENNA